VWIECCVFCAWCTATAPPKPVTRPYSTPSFVHIPFERTKLIMVVVNAHVYVMPWGAVASCAAERCMMF